VALLHADWFRGPFVPMAPNEPTHVFAARMRERERRVPFRRWRPVWQVQLSPAPGSVVVTDEPSSVPIQLSSYSSLMRRATAVVEGKRVAANPNWSVRVVDVGTGEVAFISKGE
jgi:hypothetical protein